MTRVGLPHSDIDGSTLASSSPSLFAANHVLLRPLTPRHPPCTLHTFYLLLWKQTYPSQDSLALRCFTGLCDQIAIEGQLRSGLTPFSYPYPQLLPLYALVNVLPSQGFKRTFDSSTFLMAGRMLSSTSDLGNKKGLGADTQA